MLQGVGSNSQMVKVTKKLIDEYRKSIRTYHDNKLNNTELYEVK